LELGENKKVMLQLDLANIPQKKQII